MCIRDSAMARDHGTSSFTTIHQPRSSLLACFDSLLLLSHGRCVYAGPVGPLAGPDAPGVLAFFFTCLKIRCPAAESPADWLLDVLQQRQAAHMADGRGALADLLADEYSASELAVTAMSLPADPPVPLPKAAGATLFPTSWLTQFGVLWQRTLRYKLREPAAVATQACTACVMPLLVGGIFWRIQLGQSAINDRLAAVSFLVLMQSFQCIDQVLLFPKERAVYLRDHASGLHSTSSFFLARSLAEVPFIWAFAGIAATISYWMYGLQASAANYFTFLAIIVAATDAGAGVLTSCGALSPTMEVGNLLATALLIILTLMDGFWRNLAQMPAWVRWVRVFSFSGFAVQAAAATEFRGLVFSCTPEEAVTGCIPDGEAVLRRLAFQNTDVGANIGYIVIISVGSRFVAYLALRFLHTGQSFRERLAQP
jgi:ABC-type multidrug transport system permease subunit